jgi:hypothetical protein
MMYAEMADVLGLDYCRGRTVVGNLCALGDHREGFTEPGVVHFIDRYTRSDVHTFLNLAAIAAVPDLVEDAPWRRVFRRGRLAREFAVQFGIRSPARLWSADKAFVLAGVAGLSNEVPWRKEAFDWARRPRRSTT